MCGQRDNLLATFVQISFPASARCTGDSRLAEVMVNGFVQVRIVRIVGPKAQLVSHRNEGILSSTGRTISLQQFCRAVPLLNKSESCRSSPEGTVPRQRLIAAQRCSRSCIVKPVPDLFAPDPFRGERPCRYRYLSRASALISILGLSRRQGWARFGILDSFRHDCGWSCIRDST